MLKTILQSSKTVEKAYVYDFAKPWVGNGLVTAERTHFNEFEFSSIKLYDIYKFLCIFK